MSYQAYNFTPLEIDTALRYIRTTVGAQQLIHTLGTWTPAELRIVIKIKQSFRRQYSRSRGLTEIEELLFAIWRLREHRNYYLTSTVVANVKAQRAADPQRLHHRKHKTLKNKIISCTAEIAQLRKEGYDYIVIAAVLKKRHEKMFAHKKIDPNYLGKIFRAQKKGLDESSPVLHQATQA